MMKEPDAIDIAILNRITEFPGCSIFDAIRPFLTERSETVLRYRIRALELRNLIRCVPTKHKVLLFAVEDGDDVSE